MMRRISMLAGMMFIAGIFIPWFLVDSECSAAKPFGTAKVHFEQNATDGDAEVVFEVKGGDAGLSKLTVVAPDGRTVIDFTAPDPSTLGIRQFRFESPEAGTVAALKSAYPQGVYTFTGTTAAGEKLHGTSVLSHRLPPTVSVLKPGSGAKGVSPKDLKITWTPVKGIAAYIVYIEQKKSENSITSRLPGSASHFTVPEGFLIPGTNYQLGIGTVSSEGNISFIETTFTTAGKE